MIRKIKTTILLVLSAALLGCQSPQLMKTPNLYTVGNIDPFSECPPELRNSTADILYITDRAPAKSGEKGVEYGYERSPSIAYGNCSVTIGNGVTWSTLEANSRKSRRDVRLPLYIDAVDEMGRFPETPYPRVRENGVLTEDPKVIATAIEEAGRFRNELSRRLEISPRKEVFLFVHGYNNTFEDAIRVMVNLWHFTGRVFVPIVYTWPAGRGGIKGYAYDRESGEFTIYHLKNTLKFLASCEEVEKIHILCHSRGTDVVGSAIRELLIEAKAMGADPKERLKIANLLLAAPDLDMEVAEQRFGTEQFYKAIHSLTLYISPEDKALGLSGWLFSSVQRLGRLDLTTLDSSVRENTSQWDQAVIDARVDSGFIGHSYFHSDPAVSSDLILLLKYNRKPGREDGRPLTDLGSNFWRLERGYPNFY